MASSNERREVAERLREDASCSESSPREVVESYLGIECKGCVANMTRLVDRAYACGKRDGAGEQA